MSLVESVDLKTLSVAQKSVVLQGTAYVLSIAGLPTTYAASLSSPLNTIHLFDQTNLRCVRVLQGHRDGVSSLRSVNALGGTVRPILVSSGRDGTIKVWDERIDSSVIEMTSAGQPRAILSCDVSSDGLLVAGGTELKGEDAFILFWDSRHPVAPISNHSSTHSDDVTAVRFLEGDAGSPYSMSEKALLSASSDGLICISNSEERDEDEAALHVGNWGCSVSQAGYIRQQGNAHIWAASDMETFSTWTSELDLIHDFDIRHPSIHSGTRTWVTDYLITCQTTAGSLGQAEFQAFVGSNEGDIALISNGHVGDFTSPWTLQKLWTQGHSGIVRSLLWDQDNDVLLTGGEDSKINIWQFDASAESLANRSADMVVDDDLEDMSPRPRKREWQFHGLKDEDEDMQDLKKAKRAYES